MARKIFACVIILACLCSPCYALDEISHDENPNGLPDAATLSANRMRFDAETGDFLADGNVTITAGELRVDAPKGAGNVDRREVNFDEGIAASGKWQGDKIDITAGRMLLSFAEVPTCDFQNRVLGEVGTMRLDADWLILTDFGGVSKTSDRRTRFIIVKAHKLEDIARGLSFGADTIEGYLQGGNLQEMTAKKNVWLRGQPKANGDPVNIRGDNALYSLARGSVVLSGHVVAVQGGRTLRSDSIVYFPEQNRVEALGGRTRSGNGITSTDRAVITIDLTRERRNNPPAVQPDTAPQDEQKEAPETPAPKKTTTRKTRKK